MRLSDPPRRAVGGDRRIDRPADADELARRRRLRLALLRRCPTHHQRGAQPRDAVRAGHHGSRGLGLRDADAHRAGWLVVRELDLRLATREAVRVESALRRDAEDLARALQSSLLPPRPPDIPGMELATRYLPGDGAVAVGGDFLDVFHLASNDWAIVLGDACGKGPAAAGVAALARWSARAAAVHHVEPAAVLSDVNAVLRAEAGAADDRFCTAVFGRLQLDTCGAWLTVAAAGHPLPVLVRRNGIVEERGRPGLPIGMFDTITLVTDRVGLGPGDALVFYTDGITESRNTAGETFGEERLMAVLRDVAGETSETIADAVVAAARRFGTRLRDDVAVLVVRVPDDAAPAPTDNVATATATATGSDRDR